MAKSKAQVEYEKFVEKLFHELTITYKKSDHYERQDWLENYTDLEWPTETVKVEITLEVSKGEDEEAILDPLRGWSGYGKESKTWSSEIWDEVWNAKIKDAKVIR